MAAEDSPPGATGYAPGMSPGRPDPDDNVFDVEEPEDEALYWPDQEPRTASADPLDPVDDEDPTEFEPLATRSPAPMRTVDDLEADDPFTEEPAHGELDERIRLPWRTEVVIVARGRTLPAILDASAEQSSWVGGAPSEGDAEEILWLGALTLHATLLRVPGDEEHLRLGRDVLAGRVLIEA